MKQPNGRKELKARKEEINIMMYRAITEDGREIKKFETERQAEKFWDNLNGVWTDYDNDDKEYYIYIEEIED